MIILGLCYIAGKPRFWHKTE